MQVAATKMVKINYTLKDKDGVLIDASPDGEPLEYMHGVGSLIPGLEKQMAGMQIGEKKHVVVEPAEGYGEYDENLVQTISRDRFDADFPIEVGQQFQAQTPEGTGAFMVRVTKISDDGITVDGNHELAGKQLHFDIEVVDVRDPTEQELEPLIGGGCGGSCGSCGGGCGGEEGCGCDGGCGGCGE